MHRTIRNRHGFTLVELMIVVAILGTLIALVLPAVRKAQEAGRRTTCTANLYGLAFSAGRFDEANGVLPGWLNKSPLPNQTLLGPPITYNFTTSWTVPLLPFMERKDVFENWGIATPAYIPQFVCPSSPVSDKTSPWLTYVGNAGTTLVDSSVPAVQKSYVNDGVLIDSLARSFYSPTNLSLADISERDGTATTLLFGERSGPGLPSFVTWSWSPGTMTSASPMFMNGAPFSASPPVPIFGINPNPTQVQVGVSMINNLATASKGGLSSVHPGGVVVAFCDGHTGYIRSEISPWVYAQLLSSKSKWNTTNNSYVWKTSNLPDMDKTVSDQVNAWLKTYSLPGSPYVLNEGDYK